ncbi:hypothetical protein ACFWB2_40760, partial [Streptomyces virginiae]|uniref:hypothetical protein n=1 Tax=Streptomyces virginiae TaxID=1961 RepID=UPI00369E3BAC
MAGVLVPPAQVGDPTLRLIFGVVILAVDLDGPGWDVRVGRGSPYREGFGKDVVAFHGPADGKWRWASVVVDLGMTAESLGAWVRKEVAGGVP